MFVITIILFHSAAQ